MKQINKKLNTKEIALNLKVPTYLKDWLAAYAKKESRSMNRQANLILLDYLQSLSKNN